MVGILCPTAETTHYPLCPPLSLQSKPFPPTVPPRPPLSLEYVTMGKRSSNYLARQSGIIRPLADTTPCSPLSPSVPTIQTFSTHCLLVPRLSLEYVTMGKRSSNYLAWQSGIIRLSANTTPCPPLSLHYRLCTHAAPPIPLSLEYPTMGQML